MPTNITALNQFTTPVTVPVDGDAVSYANREPSLQALANQAYYAYLRSRIVNHTTPRNWRSMSSPVSSNQPYSWSESLMTFVGSTNASAICTLSTDGGDTWSSHSNGMTGSVVSAIAWSPTLSIFAAVGFGGSVFASSSPDGLTWTGRSSLANHLWRAVVWADTLGLFVATGGNSTVDAGIATSPDGQTWTSRTTPVTADFNAVAWSNALGLLVATINPGSVSTTPQYATSTDGITWTAHTLPTFPGSTSLSGVCWSVDLGMFVIAAGQYIAYSSTGLAWTIVTMPSTLTVTNPQWVISLGSFIDFQSSKLIWSDDGINWKYVTMPSVTAAPGAIWAPGISRFASLGIVTL